MKHLTSNKTLIVVGVVFAGLAVSSVVYSHCQIPCGIYDDDLRFDMMAEHIHTIDKSMKQIIKMSAAEKPDANQLTRWITNKDDHAEKLSEIITYYFLAQRVKPVDQSEAAEYKKYVGDVTTLHRMLVLAMKTKQSTDTELIAKLNTELAAYRKSYFSQRSESYAHKNRA